jgi:hypothetical protein
MLGDLVRESPAKRMRLPGIPEPNDAEQEAALSVELHFGTNGTRAV